MDYSAFVLTLTGGGLAVVGSVATTLMQNRREDRRRWDEERLTAVAAAVDAATRMEGLHYRHARSVYDGDAREALRTRDEARRGLDELHARAARARLLMSALDGELAWVFSVESELRSIANVGLPSPTDEWRIARTNYRAAVMGVSSKAAVLLGLGGSD